MKLELSTFAGASPKYSMMATKKSRLIPLEIAWKHNVVNALGCPNSMELKELAVVT